MAKLKDIAKACKSKNAGPFEITLDIMFDDAELYERVRDTGVINAALIAKLYGVPESSVLFTPYPPRLCVEGHAAAAHRLGCGRRHRHLRRPAACPAAGHRSADLST